MHKIESREISNGKYLSKTILKSKLPTTDSVVRHEKYALALYRSINVLWTS